MPEIAVKALPEELRQLAVKARDALGRGHLERVVEITTRILARHPDCLAVRRLQREAQLKQSPDGPSTAQRAKGGIARVGALFRRKQKSTPHSDLAAADTIILADPWSRKGWTALAEAATAAHLSETAIFAWENLAGAYPEDRAAGLGLVKSLLVLDRYPAALAAVEALLRHHPKDGEALALLRRASIDQTVEKGKWDADVSFREKLRE